MIKLKINLVAIMHLSLWLGTKCFNKYVSNAELSEVPSIEDHVLHSDTT
jgi:hypothetical protein